MLRLIVMAAFGYVWFQYAGMFSLLLGMFGPPAYALALYQNGPIIFAGVLIVLFFLLSMISGSIGRARWGDGLWNSALVRRVIGLTAGALLYAALFTASASMERTLDGDTGIIGSGIAAIFAWRARRPAKIFLGRATRPVRRLFSFRHFGMGGSSRFVGLFDEWANPWEPGDVLLGRSMYDPKWLVGIKDDRHVATIATTRAGKGRSVIIPNLLTWPGSALVIDPKGQNACVTALKRGSGGDLSECLGQTVRILDPFGEIKDPELQSYVARFNPLAALDLRANDYAERVGVIADALVVPSSDGKDSFFDNAARALISGLIDYVVVSPNVPANERNLATVRGLLVHPDGPPIKEMSELGGLAQAGAAGQLLGGQNATADVLFTAITHTEWLDSTAMQKALGTSDFSLTDLNGGNTTIYLVLPPQYLDKHSRFLRLFVNLALQAATEGRKGKHATLFLLDEFYALGRLQQLAKSAGVLAGYGVKLWPIIQNIGQVQELYPQNWETFLGNAGLWQAFAMNDAATAQYLSERLGKRVLWRKMRGPQGFEWEISGVASLRDALELRKATSRESTKAAVFTESGDTFLLGRAAYDHVFKRNEYSPDPLEPNSRGSFSLVQSLTDWLDKKAEAERAARADAQDDRPKTESTPEKETEEQDQ
ncbi:type IV secretory system conjugative DNA transfer family protein [Mesorhizobium sophorae]|uniref:type IV secretory system conjugative DNA transfer family protein n=1 Tax=Mesorhizobium sophorae TaxID=1300294 RepID=UPI00142DB14F|nr:type IV secretory system conjugative DNA transfer family protein [Mesorhizobium sophorae]